MGRVEMETPYQDNFGAAMMLIGTHTMAHTRPHIQSAVGDAILGPHHLISTVHIGAIVYI